MVDNHAFSALMRHFKETVIVAQSDAAAHLRSHAGPRGQRGFVCGALVCRV